MAFQKENVRFIDEDEQINEGGVATYESIVVIQIKKCSDILSKEMIGGYYATNPKGNTEKYIDDVKENAINAVDVLRMLLQPFTGGVDDERIIKLMDEINMHKLEIVNKYRIRANMVISGTLPHKEFTEYKAVKYRELFSILVNIYHKRKADIASMSTEYDLG